MLRITPKAPTAAPHSFGYTATTHAPPVRTPGSGGYAIRECVDLYGRGASGGLSQFQEDFLHS